MTTLDSSVEKIHPARQDRAASRVHPNRLLAAPAKSAAQKPTVAPTFVLKYNIRTRSLAGPGVIEDVLAVENDVVPFDRADVLEQGCVNAFLGDSPRSPRPCDLLACQLASRREDHGQVSIIMSVLLDDN